MKVLRSRVYEYYQAQRNEEISKLQGDRLDINFGSQIRSYVYHPYRLVKDLRTGVETGNIDAVMDGELDQFIESYLKDAKADKTWRKRALRNSSFLLPKIYINAILAC